MPHGGGFAPPWKCRQFETTVSVFPVAVCPGSLCHPRFLASTSSRGPIRTVSLTPPMRRVPRDRYRMGRPTFTARRDGPAKPLSNQPYSCAEIMPPFEDDPVIYGFAIGVHAHKAREASPVKCAETPGKAFCKRLDIEQRIISRCFRS